MFSSEVERTVALMTVGLIVKSEMELIKALTAVGPLSLNMGWEIGPERGLKTDSFNS